MSSTASSWRWRWRVPWNTGTVATYKTTQCHNPEDCGRCTCWHYKTEMCITILWLKIKVSKVDYERSVCCVLLWNVSSYLFGIKWLKFVTSGMKAHPCSTWCFRLMPYMISVWLWKISAVPWKKKKLSCKCQAGSKGESIAPTYSWPWH
jgi:hypothetical protein